MEKFAISPDTRNKKSPNHFSDSPNFTRKQYKNFVYHIPLSGKWGSFQTKEEAISAAKVSAMLSSEDFKKSNMPVRAEKDMLLVYSSHILDQEPKREHYLYILGQETNTEPEVPRINFGEYGQSVQHNPTKKGYVDGGAIGLTSIQNGVMKKLSEVTSISNVYLDKNKSNDTYIIVIDQEDPDFSLFLADIYWSLFDKIQEIDSDYTFEFDHFSKDEFSRALIREALEIYCRE